MNEQRYAEDVPWVRFVSLFLGLLVLVLLLLTPLKAWLNQIPHFWQIAYPLLSLFAGYLVVCALREKETAVVTIKWVVLLSAALCASVYAWGAGHPFFTVARWLAILYIVAEVLFTIFERPAGKNSVPAA